MRLRIICLLISLMLWGCVSICPAEEKSAVQDNRPAILIMVKQLKDIQQELEKKKGKGQLYLEEERLQYELVQKIVAGIEKGKTSEKEIIDWLGPPSWDAQGIILSVLLPDLKDSQRTIGYRFSFAGNVGGEIRTLGDSFLLIAVDRNTSIIEDYKLKSSDSTY